MRMREATLLLAVIVVPFASVYAEEAIDRFAAAYGRAKNEIEKRSVCIDAIDAGLVRVGTSVATVKKLCGRDFEDGGNDSRSNRLGFVNFVAPWHSNNPMVSDVYRGWYLAVTYRPDGTLVDYCLSNAGKESAMAGRADGGTGPDGDTGLPMPSIAPVGSEKKNAVKGSHSK